MKSYVAFVIMALYSTSAISQSSTYTDGIIENSKKEMQFHYYKCNNADITKRDREGCLFDQNKKLRNLLSVALKKKYADTETYSAYHEASPEIIAKNVKSLKDDIRNSQSAWEAYTKKQCGAIVNGYEINGGSGGAESGLECQARHLAFRLSELSAN